MCLESFNFIEQGKDRNKSTHTSKQVFVSSIVSNSETNVYVYWLGKNK